MVTCQSANQFKTPAKVSWAFKMVSVWFTRLHNHGEVSTVCDDLGCNVICWCWFIVFFENQRHCTRLPRNVRALHASFCWPAFKDADFIFQQDLAPAHTANSTKSWLNDHGVGVLDWPANSPDLNPIEPQPSIEYIYSKLTYFPEGQQFTKNVCFLYLSYEVF